jgi:hypothetical protein
VLCAPEVKPRENVHSSAEKNKCRQREYEDIAVVGVNAGMGDALRLLF